jgi:hypothetical protein
MDLEEARQQARRLFDGIEPANERALIELGRREASGLGYAQQLRSMTRRIFHCRAYCYTVSLSYSV